MIISSRSALSHFSVVVFILFLVFKIKPSLQSQLLRSGYASLYLYNTLTVEGHLANGYISGVIIVAFIQQSEIGKSMFICDMCCEINVVVKIVFAHSN